MLIEGALRVADAIVLPAQDRPPPPGKLPEWGNSSPVGLMIILVLLLVTVFLIRSMSGRIRRLPESFDGETGTGAETPGGGADPGAHGSGVGVDDARGAAAEPSADRRGDIDPRSDRAAGPATDVSSEPGGASRDAG